MNILSLVSTIVSDAAAVEIDGTELAAGLAVEAPGKIQVGTTAGKPVYLFGVLSTDPGYQITQTQPIVATTTIKSAPAS